MCCDNNPSIGLLDHDARHDAFARLSGHGIPLLRQNSCRILLTPNDPAVQSLGPALESGLQPAYFSGSFQFGDQLSFVRQLEEKDRGEVGPVHLDVVTEIAFRPNLPDASKSTGHRNDSRRKVEHAGCTEELRDRLPRFLVDQSRQPQLLDPGTIMIGGRLDPPVDVSDMFEERHREMKLPDAAAAAMIGYEPRCESSLRRKRFDSFTY